MDDLSVEHGAASPHSGVPVDVGRLGVTGDESVVSSAPTDAVGGESIKQILISIIVAFSIAFVFRAFVVEPFIIPTGSMAPTLLGSHVRFHSDESAYTWAVAPRDYVDGMRQRRPFSIQGNTASGYSALRVTDPMTRRLVSREQAPLSAGDRILVLKHVYALREPRRWETIVFRNPESPFVGSRNLIKRLIGLPNEEIRIVDGDIFVRRTSTTDSFRVQRKPLRIQLAAWQTVHQMSPPAHLPEAADATQTIPWITQGWEVEGEALRTGTSEPIQLVWDVAARDEDGELLWPIEDWVWYNDNPGLVRSRGRYPVSDIRLRAGVAPESDGLRCSVVLEARNHIFEARIEDGRATLRMKSNLGDGDWSVLAEAEASSRVLAPGRVTNIELWHVDQSLQLWIDGQRMLYGEYEWDAFKRLAYAAGRDVSEGLTFNHVDAKQYQRPKLRIELGGASATLHRVALDRDLFHQPARSAPSFALGADEFFALGDNSANSRDSRAWDEIDPWVEWRFPGEAHVVPRELLVGRAFFVYLPGPHREKGLPPAPDAGRMRFIR